jgi:apolipoprotein N-acyltransferase
LDQHLITASFRAVECRTPMVRAVNTGVSAIIDGDGVIVEPDVFIDGDQKERDSMRDPKTGRWHKQLNAALVHTVPVDNRTSLYVRWGDWFAGSCGFGCLFLMFGRFLPARRSEKSAEDSAEVTVPMVSKPA